MWRKKTCDKNNVQNKKLQEKKFKTKLLQMFRYKKKFRLNFLGQNIHICKKVNNNNLTH